LTSPHSSSPSLLPDMYPPPCPRSTRSAQRPLLLLQVLPHLLFCCHVTINQQEQQRIVVTFLADFIACQARRSCCQQDKLAECGAQSGWVYVYIQGMRVAQRWIVVDVSRSSTTLLHAGILVRMLWRQAIVLRMLPRRNNRLQVISMPNQNLSGGTIKRRKDRAPPVQPGYAQVALSNSVAFPRRLFNLAPSASGCVTVTVSGWWVAPPTAFGSWTEACKTQWLRCMARNQVLTISINYPNATWTNQTVELIGFVYIEEQPQLQIEQPPRCAEPFCRTPSI